MAGSNDNSVLNIKNICQWNLVTETNHNILTYTGNRIRKGHEYKISIKAKDWSDNSSNEIVADIKAQEIEIFLRRTIKSKMVVAVQRARKSVAVALLKFEDLGIN